MMTCSELQELQKAIEICEQKVFPQLDLYIENLPLENEDREEFKNNFKKLIECIKRDSEALNKSVFDGVQEKHPVYAEIVGELVVVQNTPKYSWLKKTIPYIRTVNEGFSLVNNAKAIFEELKECELLGNLCEWLCQLI